MPCRTGTATRRAVVVVREAALSGILNIRPRASAASAAPAAARRYSCGSWPAARGGSRGLWSVIWVNVDVIDISGAPEDAGTRGAPGAHASTTAAAGCSSGGSGGATAAWCTPAPCGAAATAGRRRRDWHGTTAAGAIATAAPKPRCSNCAEQANTAEGYGNHTSRFFIGY